MNDSVLILIVMLCGLVLISSLLSIVHMLRLNHAYHLREKEAVTAALIQSTRSQAGKGGLLPCWSGVYACQTEGGSRKFSSVNIYGAEKDVPQEIRVILLSNGGVLERWNIAGHFFRKTFPTWVAAGLFATYFWIYSRGQS